MGIHTMDESSVQSSIDKLRAAVIDRRSENVRYRQNELYRIYVTLQSLFDELSNAVRQDSSCSKVEAEKECYLALDAVRQLYEGLDFEKSLKEEYLVKSGADFLNKRVGYGLLVLLPTIHSRLYSVLTAVTAAKAAGNCVLLELTHIDSRTQIDRLLIRILTETLDSDTLCISRTTLSRQILEQADVVVDQRGQDMTGISTKLLKTQQSQAIAFVDRTANVRNAARLLVDARVHAYRSSAYSPSLAIANTFIAEDLGRECLIYSADTSLSAAAGSEKLDSAAMEGLALIRKAEQNGEVKVHASPRSVLHIVEILDRDSPLLKSNLQGPYIFIVGATSMTDMVNWNSTTTLLAAYVFASLSVCKVLSEQISTEVSFVNQLPISLLHGPSAPSQMFSQHPRYTTEMFSVPKPQVVSSMCNIPMPGKAREAAMRKVKATGQKKGFAIGFFEQGILIGLGTTLLVLLTTAGVSSWYIGRRMGWWGGK